MTAYATEDKVVLLKKIGLLDDRLKYLPGAKGDKGDAGDDGRDGQVGQQGTKGDKGDPELSV